jgi:hypothetical protein
MKLLPIFTKRKCLSKYKKYKFSVILSLVLFCYVSRVDFECDVEQFVSSAASMKWHLMARIPIFFSFESLLCTLDVEYCYM